ncbi:MAG: prepilin-type N-terminal cleavage/methylation domain-containing protein [Candidatus Marinimicrobia bacterium]|nr:prepilin-type N-terminal cleavage/methylation domain-containing protein [Candidatus Neomarinimicrobiota bacterium]
MKGTLKRHQSGFTMIEIMVVVVIVAILAAIAVPTYIRYVESARASDARSTLSALYKNARLFRQDSGEWPGSVEDLSRGKYLEIDRGTLRQWSFDISGLPDELKATSLEDMVGGAGKEIRFDVERGKFLGYGVFGKDAEE